MLQAQLNPFRPPPAPAVAPNGAGMGRLLLLVGLGVGGFLLYRHFKNKAE